VIPWDGGAIPVKAYRLASLQRKRSKLVIQDARETIGELSKAKMSKGTTNGFSEGRCGSRGHAERSKPLERNKEKKRGNLGRGCVDFDNG